MEVNSQGFDEKQVKISRKDIFIIIKDVLNSELPIIFNHLQQHFLQKSKLKITADNKKKLSRLCVDFRIKYNQAQRKCERFFTNNADWLSGIISFCTTSDSLCRKSSDGGRPLSEFSSSSERSKRRKTEEIRKSFDTSALLFATKMSLRSSGQLDAAKIVQDITSTTNRAAEYKKAINSEPVIQMTDDEALCFLLDHNLSKSVYKGIKANNDRRHSKIYPSYEAVSKAKTRCYPSSDAMTFSELKAEVRLQAVLNHTVERITDIPDIFRKIAETDVNNLRLVCKWGFDGTSGQSKYKMKFQDKDASNESLFYTSIVPFQLIGVNEQKKEFVVWSNPRPSSTRFCRPLRLQFVKETTDMIKAEEEYFKEQIKSLVPHEIIINGKRVSVNFNLHLTMIDGKVCNALASVTSAQRCYLCSATSKDFNNIDDILKRAVRIDNLQYGLSCLHAWIRAFEYCLHLAYKLEIQKWQARNSLKESVQTRKSAIQKEFKEKMGLIVDVPKSGSGTSNDGNTARSFFENYAESAKITGIDETLIKRLYVLLQVISSGYEVNVDRFREYALETARLIVKLYPWYPMPTTIHKLLIHGPEIIAFALLPIGQMSEEAQESSNKLIKRYRRENSRKNSRINSMTDVFLRLMAGSDPLISSLRELPKKKKKDLSEEALDMVVFHSSGSISRETSDQSESSESDQESDSESESCGFF